MRSTSKQFRTARLLVTTACLATLLAAVPGHDEQIPTPPASQSAQGRPVDPAAEEQSSESTGNDIVVTAQRRSQSLQDVPISITAITGNVLNDQGASNLNDYFRQVPGLTVDVAGPARQRVSLRGVQSNGEATTGIYYDETLVTGPAGSAADAGSAQPDLNLFRRRACRGASRTAGHALRIGIDGRHDPYHLQQGADWTL